MELVREVFWIICLWMTALLDIKTWLSKPDMWIILLTALWSFEHSKFPYDKTLDRWLKLHTNKDVKMYIGIAVYKAGSMKTASGRVILRY